MAPIKVALQQRVIPDYRIPFLKQLAQQAKIDLHVFSGLPHVREMIQTPTHIDEFDYTMTDNVHIFNGKYYFCLQPELPKWLTRLNPDVAILEGNPRYLSSWKALHWLRNHHIGSLAWGLGVPQHNGSLSFFRNHFRSYYLHKFDGILAYSATGKQQYLAAGFSPAQVFVAPNATVARPTGPAPIRPNLFLSGRAKILFVGRLQERKKIDLLIRVCGKLSHDLRPELWIVGDGSILSQLKMIAQEFYPSTKFFGAVFGKELDAIFQQADLFVLPGTGGLAIQQAMGAGLPVIVAEGDGSQSNLVTPETGWEIAGGDEDALLKSISFALQDPTRLRRMGLAAYNKVRDEVNIEGMATVFVNAVENVYLQVSHHG